MTPRKEQHYHSFEVQEIIERVPGWTSKWGISSLFSLLCLIIAVCSIVKIPVKKKLSVILTLNTPPVYLTTQPGAILNSASTKILKGDTLIKNHVSGTCMLAPYSGTLMELNRTTNINSDTVSILLPNIVKYGLAGKIPVKFKGLINKGSKIKITIKSDNVNDGISVYGIIRQISPTASKDGISFYGTIDRKSNDLLKENFMYSSQINGFDELTISEDTIMNLLAGKVR